MSRKLWLAFIGAFVAFGNAYWDWGMTIEQILTVIGPLMIYIGVEGAKDVKAA